MERTSKSRGYLFPSDFTYGAQCESTGSPFVSRIAGFRRANISQGMGASGWSTTVLSWAKRAYRIVGWGLIGLLAVGLLTLIPLMILVLLVAIAGQSSWTTTILVIGVLLLFTAAYFGAIREMEIRDLASWDGMDRNEVYISDDDDEFE